MILNMQQCKKNPKQMSACMLQSVLKYATKEYVSVAALIFQWNVNNME